MREHGTAHACIIWAGGARPPRPGRPRPPPRPLCGGGPRPMGLPIRGPASGDIPIGPPIGIPTPPGIRMGSSCGRGPSGPADQSSPLHMGSQLFTGHVHKHSRRKVTWASLPDLSTSLERRCCPQDGASTAGDQPRDMHMWLMPTVCLDSACVEPIFWLY